MRKPVHPRRFVALLAAYVVVLQALLLPLSVAAGAVFDNSLCTASAASESRPPAGHDGACACAAGCGMQCCAHALAGPPPADFTPVVARTGIVLTPAALEAASQAAIRAPHAARAPPSA